MFLYVFVVLMCLRMLRSEKRIRLLQEKSEVIMCLLCVTVEETLSAGCRASNAYTERRRTDAQEEMGCVRLFSKNFACDCSILRRNG